MAGERDHILPSGIRIPAMTERRTVRISIETDAADETRKTVESGLYSYNHQFAGPMENRMLTIGARDEENTISGSTKPIGAPESGAGCSKRRRKRHGNQDACTWLSIPWNSRHPGSTKSRAIASTVSRKITRPVTESFC